LIDDCLSFKIPYIVVVMTKGVFFTILNKN
jgi:hypothetical protein